MKLATFEVATDVGPQRRVGVVRQGGQLVDLNAAARQLLGHRSDATRAAALADALVPADIVTLLANGQLGADLAAEALDALGESSNDPTLRGHTGARLVYQPEEVRLLSPIPRPTSIRDCSAFEEHLRRTTGDAGIPPKWYEFPVYYKGNPGSVVGTGVDIVRPAGVDRLDFELEFAIVIGRSGRDISEHDALAHVGGYTVFNDVSARRVQFREMSVHLGPAKGKDQDGWNVLGPYLVTPDEFDVTADHAMVARVDGQEWGRGSTADIYHSVARIISHISTNETLSVGDVIGSGTVGGGCGLEQGRYPEMGQVVEIEVEGLGTLSNRFVAAQDAQDV
jgi:2-keto-4-pentenoate hydratase/2-oxohepta-3-ene-1,7-dioic acid hydratase in catechol pathway